MKHAFHKFFSRLFRLLAYVCKYVCKKNKQSKKDDPGSE